jgi:tRNA-specific 2-thiouridylase
VVGVTLQLYDHGAAIQKKGACCAGQDIHDARTAAEALGIPHYVLDYESRFKQAGHRGLRRRYLRGETPVPCVRCNQTVKFRDLLDVARELGAEAMATGHYVRRTAGAGRPAAAPRRRSGPRPELFPVRHHAATSSTICASRSATCPSRTRELAEARPVGRRQARQPGHLLRAAGPYTTVIDRCARMAREPGDIVHMDGRVLGRHEGVTRYTIGQRRGLNVAVGDPLFVVKLDADSRPGDRRPARGPADRTP